MTYPTPGPHHPPVMFEIMANDRATLCYFYNQVFGWSLDPAQPDFSYIHFPTPVITMGGIGDANPAQPGWHKGIAFYLLTPSVDDTLRKVQAHGGSVYVPKTVVPKDRGTGDYVFAMFQDPEQNIIGIIEPFASTVQ